MKQLLTGFVLAFLVGCGNAATTSNQNQTEEQVKDTNQLITDSVEVPDTTTADIDEMKKRN